MDTVVASGAALQRFQDKLSVVEDTLTLWRHLAVCDAIADRLGAMVPLLLALLRHTDDGSEARPLVTVPLQAVATLSELATCLALQPALGAAIGPVTDVLTAQVDNVDFASEALEFLQYVSITRANKLAVARDGRVLAAVRYALTTYSDEYTVVAIALGVLASLAACDEGVEGVMEVLPVALPVLVAMGDYSRVGVQGTYLLYTLARRRQLWPALAAAGVSDVLREVEEEDDETPCVVQWIGLVQEALATA